MSKKIKDMTSHDWWVFFTSPKGRITRFDYNVKFFLFVFILSQIALAIDFAMQGRAIFEPGIIKYATTVFQILIVWPVIAVGVKRLHDLNYKGWWLLLFYGVILVSAFATGGLAGYYQKTDGMIPFTIQMVIVGIAILSFVFVVTYTLILCCIKGTKGPNRFGSDPLADDTISVTEGSPL